MPVNSFADYPMSWRPEIPAGAAPLYQRLADRLRADIRSGVLRPGTKLPPQRELADFLDINISTVARAFRVCAAQGLLTGTVGSGTFVTYRAYTDLIRPPVSDAVIELGSMTPETAPLPELTELLGALLAEDRGGALYQYSRGLAPWQRHAAAALLEAAGCPVPEGQILTASGGQNALAAVFSGLIRPGDRVGVDPLVYPGVMDAARLLGVRLVPVAADGGGQMSPEALARAVRTEGLRAVYLMPDGQNPTARVLTEARRDALAEVVRSTGLLVIEDGITSLLEPDTRSLFARVPEQTVFVLSLSKTVAPMLRLAYVAAPEPYRAALERALYALDLSQSRLSIELASRLIASGRLEMLLARRRAQVRARNAVADRVLAGLPLSGGARSLCRFLSLPQGTDSAVFEQRALERGVQVYGSYRFAAGSRCGTPGARLAVCAPASEAELETALTRLRELYTQL